MSLNLYLFLVLDKLKKKWFSNFVVQVQVTKENTNVKELNFFSERRNTNWQILYFVWPIMLWLAKIFWLQQYNQSKLFGSSDLVVFWLWRQVCLLQLKMTAKSLVMRTDWKIAQASSTLKATRVTPRATQQNGARSHLCAWLTLRCLLLSLQYVQSCCYNRSFRVMICFASQRRAQCGCLSDGHIATQNREA